MRQGSLAILMMAFVVVGAAVGGAGCTKRNPDVCCTSPDDCAAVGLPNDSTCASGLACSSDHSCEPSGCGSDADCSGTTPVCTGGFCVACDDTHGCTSAAPVCELSAEPVTCGDCGSDTDCAGYSATPHCGSAGACVACANSTQCANPTPICGSATNTCEGCTLDTDCASDVCDIDTGACLEHVDLVCVCGRLRWRELHAG